MTVLYLGVFPRPPPGEECVVVPCATVQLSPNTRTALRRTGSGGGGEEEAAALFSGGDVAGSGGDDEDGAAIEDGADVATAEMLADRAATAEMLADQAAAHDVGEAAKEGASGFFNTSREAVNYKAARQKMVRLKTRVGQPCRCSPFTCTQAVVCRH
jgi:hypothetical protein